MTERKLSTLGYLMDRLGLSTAALARRLHVDASLVSNGAAAAGGSALSPYILMRYAGCCWSRTPWPWTDALRSLVPLEEPKREEGERGKRGDGSLSEAEGIWGTEGISGTGGSSGTEELLYRVLNDRHFTVPKAFTFALRHSVQRRLPYIPAEREASGHFRSFGDCRGHGDAGRAVLCGFGADRMAAGGYCLCQGMGGTDGPAAGPGICF